MKRTLLALGTTGTLLLGTAGAQGATINSALFQAASNSGNLGVEATYNFNDLSRADYFDVDGSDDISANDVILGSLVLDTVEPASGGGSVALTDVSGVYALAVDNPSNADGETTFRALNSSDDTALQNGYGVGSVTSVLNLGEMVALYQGGNPTDASTTPASGTFFNGDYSDGDLYGTFNDLPDYVIEFVSLDLTSLAGATDGANIGEIKGSKTGLGVVDDGTGSGEGIGDLNLETIIPPFPNGTVVGVNGSVKGSASSPANGDFTFTDSAQFQIRTTIIPSPTAGLAGLGLLGLGLMKRRRA